MNKTKKSIFLVGFDGFRKFWYQNDRKTNDYRFDARLFEIQKIKISMGIYILNFGKKSKKKLNIKKNKN